MATSREEIARRRDNKIRAAMAEQAPVWLLNDNFHPRQDSLVFDLVYANQVYGWVRERYKYDTFNDVLYHMGAQRLSEDEVLKIQEQEPYLPAEFATRVPFEPAFRQSSVMPRAAK